jgi:hypothetical protein
LELSDSQDIQAVPAREENEVNFARVVSASVDDLELQGWFIVELIRWKLVME